MFRAALIVASFFITGVAAAQPVKSKLFDGFEGKDFSPDGGLYYRENFEQSAGTAEFQSIVKRNGNGGLKLSVVPICPDSLDGSRCSRSNGSIPGSRLVLSGHFVTAP